jgi:hypothetical protein
MLVNKDYKNAVTVTVKAEGMVEWYDKENGVWDLCDGTLTILPGDGELLRVI